MALYRLDSVQHHHEALFSPTAVLLLTLALFRPEPTAVPNLRAAGFDILGLANNHNLDGGGEGLAGNGRCRGRC